MIWQFRLAGCCKAVTERQSTPCPTTAVIASRLGLARKSQAYPQGSSGDLIQSCGLRFAQGCVLSS